MATVIYDPDCGFCRWSLALLLLWGGRRGAVRDGAKGERLGGAERGPPSPPNWQLRWGGWAAHGTLRPLPLRSPEANDLLADLTEDQRDASWHLVVDGRRFSAGGALAPALRLLPGGGLPAALFARFPRVTERGYRWVADHRGLLGRFVPARARRWADRVIARSLDP
jgi:predicted DCC family thiol-disulfide oxidoreductase YuxK